CLLRSVCAVKQQEFLLEDGVGHGRIKIVEVRTWCDQFPPGRQDSWARDAACVDRVTQLRVAVNTRVAKVANGRNTALQVFSSQLCSDQSPLARRFYDGQQLSRCKQSIVTASNLRFGRHDDVEKQMCMGVNQPRQ